MCFYELLLAEKFEVDDINKYLPPEVRVFGARRVTKGFNSKSQCSARTYAYLLPTYSLIPFEEGKEESINLEEFRLKPDALENVNRLLQNYVGTKNYHNFTSKKKPTDPSANRYIMSFVCEPPIVRKNVEFALMKVKGKIQFLTVSSNFKYINEIKFLKKLISYCYFISITSERFTFNKIIYIFFLWQYLKDELDNFMELTFKNK